MVRKTCFTPAVDGWIELASAHTGTGDLLVLRERAGIVELRCNGWELMSNRAHRSEEALAEAALAAVACREVPCGRSSPPLPGAIAPRVLIGGLGFGYTLRAALNRLPRTARVVVAELLPEIIAWNHGVLALLAGNPVADPRVSVTCTDILSLLHATEPASFDVILLDTDNGPDSVMLPGNSALYGPAGLRLIRHALDPDGTLAVWSADRSPRFEHTLHDAGFRWYALDVPARGAPDDPLHTIYLGRNVA